jgi:hypothetical protein
MTQFARPTRAAADYDSTIIGALELSEKKWMLAVQLPGVKRHSRHVVEARGDELAAFVERLKARCAVAGHNINRVILTHEAGRDGFWLAGSADALFRRSLEVARAQGARAWELRTATSWARFQHSQKRSSEAYELLAPVLDLFTEGFATADFLAASALRAELQS